MNNSYISCIHDLNLFFQDESSFAFFGEDGYAILIIGIRLTDGLFAPEVLQPDDYIETCASQSRGPHLLGSIFGSRFCATDGYQFISRHRDQVSRLEQNFLSHLFALQNDKTIYPGQRQSCKTVGNFCGHGAAVDQNGSHTLLRRADNVGAKRIDCSHGLSAGFDDHRPVFESVQFGDFSDYQSYFQAPYVDGFEGFHSRFYSNQQRQDARFQGARTALRARPNRGWGVLRNGQDLRRLHQTKQTV